MGIFLIYYIGRKSKGNFMPNYRINEWCGALAGIEREFKVEWNAGLYKLGGKMFAMIGHNKEGEEIISLKNKPEKNEALRAAYADITPGYYLNPKGITTRHAARLCRTAMSRKRSALRKCFDNIGYKVL